MLLITDESLLSYLTAKEKLKIDEFINKKLFSVSNTPLSYRQVNSLDADKLLPNDRKNEASWRKFSYKELTYILIIHELKKFGFKHEQLKQLWAAFFKEPTKNRLNKPELNKSFGEIAIGLVMLGVEITLAIDSEGSVLFYDPIHTIFLDVYSADKPNIVISLNDIFNKLIEGAGHEPIPIKLSLRDLVFKYLDVITPKEEELIKIIRDKNYNAVRVKKKDGDIALIYAELGKNIKGEITPEQLLGLIKKGDFQDINIIKRDGKIVSFKIEETIKPS